MPIPNFGPASLAETVGFIRQLPHGLVDACRATLEETVEARLLLHVVDCHSDERQMLIEEVNKVLAEIGADEVPTLLVFNKVDLLGEQHAGIERDEHGKPWRVWVSAHTGAGIPDLLAAIAELLGEDYLTPTLTLTPAQGRVRSRFYQLGTVLSETTDEQGNTVLQLRLPRADFLRLLAEAGIDPAPWLPDPAQGLDSTSQATDSAV